MKLSLSATEGRKMLCALRDLAIERGWDEDELEESDVLAEYGAAIDAAMNAIGLSIEINPDEEDDDEDDFDFEEDNFEDDEDDEDDDDCQYALTVKGDFIRRYMEVGNSFKEACEVANLLFGEDE